MPAQRDPDHIRIFPETLWSRSAVGNRSGELTPLYVDRFRGPRRSTASDPHDYWEITAVLGGEGRLESTESRPLKPWDVCLVPPGLAHREASEGIMDTIWLGFRSPRLDKRTPQAKVLATIHSRSLAEEIERFWIFSKQSGGAIGPELDAHCSLLLSRFHRLLQDGTRPDSSLVQRLLRHMEKHFAEPIEVGSLAQEYGCSTGYLYRLFRQKTGYSPQAWLTRLRLNHAIQLLQHSDLPITEIAPTVGYRDPLYFSRIFRRSTGESPSGYRRNHRTPG
ncbi:helix-turn-helix domain-containing protein [Puniceicoccus vermicola]|uniref:Helix-turn-helix domain-containing protein n=1 Tax=Puniceicoccus vermicola TaxID=388746 RepID=A0A7X1B2A7_9BACT|nr:AraC family transcriptional regulator [Puniceicoccus vermicola]MBC2603253.1 helix-turn-helix domain-containing protein [Puniceicoccus vermicola]